MNNIIPIQSALTKRAELVKVNKSRNQWPGNSRTKFETPIPPYIQNLTYEHFLRGMIIRMQGLATFEDQFNNPVFNPRIVWQQFTPEQKAKIFERQVTSKEVFDWNFWELN